jgi:hypothetical protein
VAGSDLFLLTAASERSGPGQMLGYLDSVRLNRDITEHANRLQYDKRHKEVSPLAEVKTVPLMEVNGSSKVERPQLNQQIRYPEAHSQPAG